jgi:PAS domain S-box-containing protein
MKDEEYRSLVDNAVQGIFSTAPSGRFIMLNPVMAQILGYDSPDEAMHKIMDVGVDVFADPTQYAALMARLLLEERIRDAEVPFKKPDGTRGFLMLHLLQVRSGEGKPIRIEGICIDITARKNAEDELRILASIVRNSRGLVNLATLDGTMVFLNEAGSRMLGIDQERFRESNILDVIPDHLLPMVRHELLPALLRGDTWEGDLQYRNLGTGRLTDVHAMAFTIEDPTSKRPRYLANVSHGLDERRQAERVLRESGDMLGGITKNMPGFVYRMYAFPGGKHRVSYASERLTDIFGIARDLDTLFPTFTAHVYEKDRERFLASVQKAVEERITWDFEGRFVKPSGEMIWFHGRSTPTRFEDRLVFDGLMLDVTEHKQAEEKYQKVFMMTPDCIAITRMSDGRILEVNQGFEDMTGWKRNGVVGKTSTEIRFWVDPSDRALMVHDLESGRDIMNRNFLFRRQDGVERTGSYSARSTQIAGETCLIFLLQDITERTLLEEERQKLEQQLFQSQKMDAIGRLAGGVAHDFNNVLSVIMGNTEMALEEADPASPLHKALLEILNAGQRSADLTRQLLAFARKQAVSPKVLDLNDKVTGILKMLQRLIGENIRLAWVPGRDLWRVRIDPSQVDQLLANLTVNARDAMHQTGQITIETSNVVCDEAYRSAHPEWAPGEYVLLAVSDNGCGMDDDVLAQIFQPFFTTKKEGRGTGLGLATVYGIVKQNSGFIDVHSEPAHGTTFRIFLPRQDAEAYEVVEETEMGEMPRGMETILIVEDDHAVLNISRSMLEMLGYSVLAVGKPDQAVRLAEQHEGKIDMLLTDVVMPEMNGKDLSERIRAIKPDIRCVYMSGYTADVISRQGVLEEGINFLSKPFTRRDLAAKVREALRSDPEGLPPGARKSS